MNRRDLPWKPLVLLVALSTVPLAFGEGLRWAMGAPFSWPGFATRWAFIVGVLLVGRWTAPAFSGGGQDVLPWSAVIAVGGGLTTALVYHMKRSTWAAWLVLGFFYLLLLWLDSLLVSRRGPFWRIVGYFMLAAVGGGLPSVINQVESHFAEEEFFVALQALALSALCFLLLVIEDLISRRYPAPARRGLRVDSRWIGFLLIPLSVGGLVATVHAYQTSFFPLQAPTYAGISPDAPFICGQAMPDPQTFDGKAVFQQLLDRVAANPDPEPPEYGMLALGSGERRWAEAFRESLLQEAGEMRYTDPVNSVKWGQHEAALRAYYLPRVQAAFPDLFTDDELASLREWFAAINRRSMTVEWVDWMYGLALSAWPEGPYENQENGAGLLAILEAEGLAAQELSTSNRQYLDRAPRGWSARFRNTDDSFGYQIEWITNAYFQSLYTGEIPEDNLRLSFEWLLLQALPDGAPLGYNQQGLTPLARPSYFATLLLQDPRYLWLAARALGDLEEQGAPLSAQPGAEQPIRLTGQSPSVGSCLLYGDSGLPNQVGPLAPDKIVFRDGWAEDSAYLLLNLRFTGWHRYKATNTISLLYKNGPLVTDMIRGERFRWLPKGRSLFRDKRIPRENLNGLLIESSGLAAVIYDLTAIGSPWAQDPPYYAEVISFETGEELDTSHTRLEDWQGWEQDRWIYFHHQGGPIVVVDQASGPSGQEAALTWHLSGQVVVEGQRVQLDSPGRPAELLLLPLQTGSQGDLSVEPGSEPDLSRVTYAAGRGQLGVVTLFLPGDWVGADVTIDRGNRALQIRQEQALIVLPLPVGP